MQNSKCTRIPKIDLNYITISLSFERLLKVDTRLVSHMTFGGS